MSEDVMRLPVEVSEGQLTEQLISATGDNSTTNWFRFNIQLSLPITSVATTADGNTNIQRSSVSLRLFCTRHDVRLILAVVELRCSTQFLVFLCLSELLQLLQVAWKLVAIQGAFNLKTTHLSDACGPIQTPPRVSIDRRGNQDNNHWQGHLVTTSNLAPRGSVPWLPVATQLQHVLLYGKWERFHVVWLTNLSAICELKERVVQEKSFEVRG